MFPVEKEFSLWGIPASCWDHKTPLSPGLLIQLVPHVHAQLILHLLTRLWEDGALSTMKNTSSFVSWHVWFLSSQLLLHTVFASVSLLKPLFSPRAPRLLCSCYHTHGCPPLWDALLGVETLNNQPGRVYPAHFPVVHFVGAMYLADPWCPSVLRFTTD